MAQTANVMLASICPKVSSYLFRLVKYCKNIYLVTFIYRFGLVCLVHIFVYSTLDVNIDIKQVDKQTNHEIA